MSKAALAVGNLVALVKGVTADALIKG